MRAETARKLAARLGLLGAGYLVLVLLIASQEGPQVYAAEWSRRGIDTTLARGWRRTDVITADGMTLDAVVASPPGPPKATVLYLHGNAASIWSGQVREKLRAYQGLGYRVLAIDYRGYGRNAGTPSERGLYADALAAARFAEDSLGVAPTALLIHGMSLGSGVAAELAVRRPPRLLILDGAYPSLPDVAADHYPWLPVRLMMRNRFPILARLDSLRSPVLVVHATNDEVIPFKFGERLAAATTTPTWFLATRGGHVAGAFGELERFGWTLEGILTPGEERDWGWWGP